MFAFCGYLFHWKRKKFTQEIGRNHEKAWFLMIFVVWRKSWFFRLISIWSVRWIDFLWFKIMIFWVIFFQNQITKIVINHDLNDLIWFLPSLPIGTDGHIILLTRFVRVPLALRALWLPIQGRPIHATNVPHWAKLFVLATSETHLKQLPFTLHRSMYGRTYPSFLKRSRSWVVRPSGHLVSTRIYGFRPRESQDLSRKK